MRNTRKGILQILNEKIKLIIFIVVYLLILKVALSFQIDNPYLLIGTYLLLPLLGGWVMVFIYTKVIASLKGKRH